MDKVEETDEDAAPGVFLITLTCCSSDDASVANEEQEHTALARLLLGEISAEATVVAPTGNGFDKQEETADTVKVCGGEEELESDAPEPRLRWSVKSSRPGAKVGGTEEEEEEGGEQVWQGKGDIVEVLGCP